MTPREKISRYRFQILVESESTWMDSTDLLLSFFRLHRYKKVTEFQLYVLFVVEIRTALVITDLLFCEYENLFFCCMR